MYERTYHKTVLKTDTKDGKKKRRRINWKLIVRIVIAAAIIAGIIVLVRLPRLQVKHVTVTGANVVDPGDITEFIHRQLQGNTLFILPKSSIFLVPEHGLEKNIKKHFSRLESVSVSRANFSTLDIAVSEYQGVYLWCLDDMTCYFMDENGIVYAPAPYFSGDAYPKVFAGTMQSLPFQAVSADQINTITLMMERLPIIGIDPEAFHFISPHELDIDFNHKGHPALLKFDPTASIKNALVALYTGLRTDPLASDFHNDDKILQYIDLRFANRVVFKF